MLILLHTIVINPVYDTRFNRCHFLRANKMMALASGLSSMANEEGLLRNTGSESGLIKLGSNENALAYHRK